VVRTDSGQSGPFCWETLLTGVNYIYRGSVIVADHLLCASFRGDCKKSSVPTARRRDPITGAGPPDRAQGQGKVI
jgi:hypothetical protein